MTSAPKPRAARPSSRRQAKAPVMAPQDPLRDRLLATVELLKRRRAGEIGEDTIEAYVNLHWMEWHGGSLRLTTTGENVCKHLASLLSRASPQPAS